MDKKETLMQYRETEREIVRLEREVEEWRSRAERMTYSYSLAPSRGGDGRGMENTVLHLHELTMALAGLLGEQAERRRTVGGIIDAVPDPKLRTVLRLRYIEGETIQQIADDLGYCWHHVNRQHSKALSLLEG